MKRLSSAVWNWFCLYFVPKSFFAVVCIFIYCMLALVLWSPIQSRWIASYHEKISFSNPISSAKIHLIHGDIVENLFSSGNTIVETLTERSFNGKNFSDVYMEKSKKHLMIYFWGIDDGVFCRFNFSVDQSTTADLKITSVFLNPDSDMIEVVYGRNFGVSFFLLMLWSTFIMLFTGFGLTMFRIDYKCK